MRMKINWTLVASDVTAALTAISMIPYDKDTMELINHVVPAYCIPWVIKAGIVSTLALRLFGRYLTPKTATV